MSKKSVLLTAVLVVALFLMGVAMTSAQTGQATLTVINYVGSELNFTLDGKDYRVPGTDVNPDGGQLTLSLDAGIHDYSGVVPGGPGANGQVDLSAGETYILGTRVDTKPAVIANDGTVLQKPKDVLVFFQATEQPGAPAPTPERAALQPIPAGMGALVLDNYIGEELNVDIGGTLYKVPVDGRLQINLDPGTIDYTASVSTSSLNETADIMAGEYTGLGFSRDYREPAKYDVGDQEPTPVPLKMYVEPVDLSGAAMAQPTEESMPASEQATPAATEMPMEQGTTGLKVMDYTSNPLTLTIANVQYTISEGGAATMVALDPGTYSYTVSVPGAAYNGQFTLQAGVTLGMSVATNPEGNVMFVYFE